MYLRIHKRAHTYTPLQESYAELAESFKEYDTKWYFGPENSPGWAAAVETGMRCACVCVCERESECVVFISFYSDELVVDVETGIVTIFFLIITLL